jgi:hypothetical protein
MSCLAQRRRLGCATLGRHMRIQMTCSLCGFVVFAAPERVMAETEGWHLLSAGRRISRARAASLTGQRLPDLAPCRLPPTLGVSAR